MALITVPNLVASLLLDENLSDTGLAVARLTGISLLALAVVAWRGRREHGKSAARAAMFTYLGVDGHLVGRLQQQSILEVTGVTTSNCVG
jgi:hypothetical protein